MPVPNETAFEARFAAAQTAASYTAAAAAAPQDDADTYAAWCALKESDPARFVSTSTDPVAPVVPPTTAEVIHQKLRDEVDMLKAQLTAVKSSTTAHVATAKAPVTYQKMLAVLGGVGLVDKMSRAQQADFLGADASVADANLRALFGRGVEARTHSEARNVDPRRCAILREFALTRRCFAN